MEEAEIHHDRPALSGVIRELEAQPSIDCFLETQDPRRTKRLRQAVGVVVRMIMKQRGLDQDGKKGFPRSPCQCNQGHKNPRGAYHNTGGLAFWFLRAERYALLDGMPFRSVRERSATADDCSQATSVALTWTRNWNARPGRNDDNRLKPEADTLEADAPEAVTCYANAAVQPAHRGPRNPDRTPEARKTETHDRSPQEQDRQIARTG